MLRKVHLRQITFTHMQTAHIHKVMQTEYFIHEMQLFYIILECIKKDLQSFWL